jgi:hypothetical protein
VEGQQINKHNGQEEYHPALFLSIKVKRKAHSPFLFHPRFAFASSFTQLCYPPPVIHHTGHNVIGEKGAIALSPTHFQTVSTILIVLFLSHH